MAKHAGAHFSFKFMRETILRDHHFDIRPLWNWLVKEKGLPGFAKVTSNVVSTTWGVYAKTRPLTPGEQASPKKRRHWGVWQALWQCHLASVSQLRQAQFLVDFGKALSRAQADLKHISADLAIAQESYVAGLKEHLVNLRQFQATWRNAVRNVNLPGTITLGETALWFRGTTRCLADLHANITHRLASPAPVAPRVRRGPREQHLLKKIARILRDAAFSEDEIRELVLDEGSPIHAKLRVRDRLRAPRSHRRKRQAQADQYGPD